MNVTLFASRLNQLFTDNVQNPTVFSLPNSSMMTDNLHLSVIPVVLSNLALVASSEFIFQKGVGGRECLRPRVSIVPVVITSLKSNLILCCFRSSSSSSPVVIVQIVSSFLLSCVNPSPYAGRKLNLHLLHFFFLLLVHKVNLFVSVSFFRHLVKRCFMIHFVHRLAKPKCLPYAGRNI